MYRKAVGFLVYLAAAPFVAVFLWLFLNLTLQFALVACGLPQDLANAAGVVLLPPVGVLTLAWAIRDFRRRILLRDTGPPFSNLLIRLFRRLSPASKPSKKTARPPESRRIWDRELGA